MGKSIKYILFVFVLFLSVHSWGDIPKGPWLKFNPQRFQAEMEQYITTQAMLTPEESASFFPLYRELMKKQRVIFEEMHRYRYTDLSNNRACMHAVQRMDALDLQMKKLQQIYHNKFLKILPPKKVFLVIRAEEKFHRQAFKRMAEHKKK